MRLNGKNPCVAGVIVATVWILAVGPLLGEGDKNAVEIALQELEWRSVGPAEMAGRTVDIAGVPGNPNLIYIATGSGGLWKTTNRGVTWESIFESGNTLSLGALALAPSDPNVIYLGTGEHNPRNSASIGDGVYKSTDAGKTWKHLGLEATEKIARIRVHPTDPDLVFVAALGHEWGANEERGIYRSRDGGESWEKVLYVNEDTGASDLSLDANNPRVLYAGMYDFRRLPWHFRSGGPGSGLYRSVDGGESWVELTDEQKDNGLPKGVVGRIGVAVAPSDSRVVYAMIESKDGVLWRSGDSGESWTMVSDSPQINNRPFYYTDLRVDPSNANRLYAVSGRLSVSIDGGKTWRRIAGTIHGDHQSFWINPDDPNHLIDGSDGGWSFSYDGGETWDFVNVVPLGQFYQVGVDMNEPYTICGGLQDNDVWCGPSRTMTVAGILVNDWFEIHGPGDGMYVQIDPRDPTNIYTNSQGGNIIHFDGKTGEARSIHPYPVPLSGSAAKDHPYRFNWNAPIHMSPNDPETIYFGSNVLFKTADGGHTWDEISPDLTTNNTEKLVSSGGPITPDNTSAEYHCTIITIAESPLTPGLIWVGTDDGNVQVTRDGGETWKNVLENIPGLPPDSWVSRIEASRADAGTAYAAFDRHRLNDPAPYVYKTTDTGATWTNISDNLPPLNYVHVIREDPRNAKLVYVGTEMGIFASWSGGGEWSSIRLNLPPVAVRDIIVHPRDNDLVIGTHGRSVWVFDDIAPLQELDGALKKSSHLFTSRPAIRFMPWKKRFRMDIGDRVFIGKNPPYGALLAYYLKDDLETEGDDEEEKLKIEILDAQGNVIREVEGPGKAGVHRVAWDLRREPTPKPEDKDAYNLLVQAPLVVPGPYSAKLKVGDEEMTVPVEVRLRKGLDISESDLRAQHDALAKLQEMAKRGADVVRSIDDVKAQLEALSKRLEKREGTPEDITADAKKLVGELDGLRDEMARPDGELGYRAAGRLLEKIRSLSGSIGAATAPPTAAQSKWLTAHESQLGEFLGRFDKLLNDGVGDLVRRMTEAGIPSIIY
jgi:photosystem II stability/assembly factor-like uncharacterized protein